MVFVVSSDACGAFAFRDVFIVTKSARLAFRLSAVFISEIFDFVVSVVFVKFSADTLALAESNVFISVMFAFVAKVVFVAWSELRSAFNTIAELKVFALSFVPKAVLKVVVFTFNARFAVVSAASALVAKVVFVAFNAVISAFNAIPVLYGVASNFAVKPASTCVFV